jgi:hypothetical protein
MAAPTPRSDDPTTRQEEEPSGGYDSDEARRPAGRRGEGDRRRSERHEGRLRDLARRILADRERPARDPEEESERDGYVPLETAREMMASLLETGDRAKTEMVRMVAREVRHYLTELKLGHELRNMLDNYELDVHATFAFRPQRHPEPEAPAAEKPTEVAEEA